MVLANGRAILSIVYAQQERGRALGLASMAFHLGYISGPSVAGVLIDTVGWRWIFFLNLPVALTAAYMARKVLPETPIQRQSHALDQRKSSAPLLDLSLFRIRVLSAGVLSHLFVVISHSSTFFLLPFYLQGILHFSPTQVGVTVIFFSLVIVFLAPLAGWLGDRLGSRLLCTTGSALSLISMLGFSRLGEDSDYISVMIPLMILGVGWSIFQAPNLSAIFSAVEPRYVGAVSGISLTSANIANSMGVAIGSVLFLRCLIIMGSISPGCRRTRDGQKTRQSLSGPSKIPG